MSAIPTAAARYSIGARGLELSIVVFGFRRLAQGELGERGGHVAVVVFQFHGLAGIANGEVEASGVEFVNGEIVAVERLLGIDFDGLLALFDGARKIAREGEREE